MIYFHLVIDVTIAELVTGNVDLKQKVVKQDAIYDNQMEEIRGYLEDRLTRDKRLILGEFDKLLTIPSKYFEVCTELKNLTVNRDEYLSSYYYKSQNLPVNIECCFDDKAFIKDVRKRKRLMTNKGVG